VWIHNKHVPALNYIIYLQEWWSRRTYGCRH